MEAGEVLDSKIDAPPPYVPRALYHPQIYWIRPPNVVLRVCQVIFTLIAFSVMADLLRDAFNSVRAFPYVLAVSVLAFLYSLAHLVLAVWCIVRGSTRSMPHFMYQYFSFVGDQAIAYFLISSGSAAAGVVNFAGWCRGSNYCSRITGCLTFVFLAFLAFCGSALLSGFHLVRCILRA